MSDDLNLERDALIAEIHEAFRDVSRKGGISWSESEVIDAYGTKEQQRKARESDTEMHWSQLVDDERWFLGSPGMLGGFTFLDAIGFRYYLPPTMIRCLRSLEEEGGICRHLSVSFDGNYRKEEPWFDDRQYRCIARFLWFMARRTDDSCWLEPLEAYWQKFLGPPVND